MNKKSTLTLDTFKKDKQENQLSKDTEAKLARLAAIPAKTIQKQDVAIKQASVAPGVAKNDQNNKAAEAPAKLKEDKAQQSNKPQAKKASFNKEDHYAVMKYLQKHYPKCFPDEPPLLPLAIGIHHQLLATKDFPFSKTKIRRFFANYTRTKKYLSSIIVGADRVGLDGVPTSKVTKEETKDIKHKNANSKTNKESEQKPLEKSSGLAIDSNTGAE